MATPCSRYASPPPPARARANCVFFPRKSPYLWIPLVFVEGFSPCWIPLLQASFSIFVLFVSYVLHANYNPFLPRVTTQSLKELADLDSESGKPVNRRANAAPALAVKTADFVRLCVCVLPWLVACV
jgi:hypothetical protein